MKDMRMTGRPRHAAHWLDRRTVIEAIGEALGTATLMFVGLSAVFGLIILRDEFVVFHTLPPIVFRAICGFVFASIVVGIAASPIGRLSPCHYNPSVTIAFWLEGSLKTSKAGLFIVAQIAGSTLGSLILSGWGETWRDLGQGLTIPSADITPGIAIAAEAIGTFLLVATVLVLTWLRAGLVYSFTLIPILFAGLSAGHGALTGTSVNFARTLGPALVAGNFEGLQVYLIGPIVGGALAAAFLVRAKLGVNRLRPTQ